MPHHEPKPFAKLNARLAEVRKALDENDHLLSEKIKSPVARNTNTAIRYLVETVARLEADMIQLHAKLQPVLKQIRDDSDWRNSPIWRDRDE